MSKKVLLRMPVKTSILELRKEKSRDAARSRRGKENYEFYELAKLLPLPAAITSQLDKASIIRLSISYLKLRDFSGHGDPPWNRDPAHHNKTVKGGPPRRRSNSSIALDLFESHHGTHILQSLDGFAFILGNDGRFLYISETVSIYLGLSQVEMAGSSIFDYVHQQDHPELAEHLGLSLPQGSASSVSSPDSSDEGSPTSSGTPRCMSPPGHDVRGYVMNPNPKKGCDRSFCLRMKSTLTKRGVHVKSSGYRVVHVLGQLRPQMTLGLGRKCAAPVLGLVGVAIALPPPTVTELRLEHDTFITRMAPDFTVTFCESLVSDFMDLSAEDMTNRSLYDLCHAGDIANLRQSHVNVLTKGQAMTDYYRLLNRQGGYVWIQTCVTTLLNNKNVDDQTVLAINYVLSGVEKSNSVMNMWQMCGEMSPAHTRTSSPTSASFSCAGQDQNSSKDYGSSADSEKTKGANPQHKDSGNNKGPQPSQRIPCTRSPMHVGQGGSADSGDGDTDGLSDSDVLDASADGGGQYAEKNEVTHDAKNSRRKMERPRKRKREELECGVEEGGGRRARVAASTSPPQPDNRLTSTEARPPSTTTTTNNCNPAVVPSPQDLSLKPASSPSAGSGSVSSPVVLSPIADSARPASNSLWQRGAGGSSDGASGGSALGGCSAGSLPHVTSNTVRELEAVMNRHLPFLDTDPIVPHHEAPRHGQARSSGSINSSSNNNYHAQAAKKSTIQWVGSHSTPAAVAAATADVDAMTASKFLRSLYESRESVIRSSGNCHVAVSTNSATSSSSNLVCSNGHGVGNGGQRVNHAYTDVPGTLLTPPGLDAYRDQPPPFTIPSIVISTASSSHASTPLPLASSCSSPILSSSSSSSSASMKGGAGCRYPSALSLSLPYTSLADAYSMTPPSSVSPQDKHASPFAAAAAALVYNESAHSAPCGLRSHHALLPSSQAGHVSSKDAGLGSCGSMSGVHAQDYGTAKAAYYAMSALGSGHASYADVNHNTAPAYDQCSRSVIPWY